MAREVVINFLCDACLAEGQRTEGEELPPLIMGTRGKVKTLALCEKDRKELYEPLAELYQRAPADQDSGAPPIAAAPRRAHTRAAYGPFPEGEWPCPVSMAEGSPDCDATDLKDKASVQKHMARVHDTTLGKYLASQAASDGKAPTLDMPLRHIPETGVKMFCPVVGCNLNATASKNKRSLATHFNQRHGIPIGDWFRQHPDVDPEALLVRDGDEVPHE